jgi:ubiquinone/menaquinone biosynthesis C-methylase UbiE
VLPVHGYRSSPWKTRESRALGPCHVAPRLSRENTRTGFPALRCDGAPPPVEPTLSRLSTIDYVIAMTTSDADRMQRASDLGLYDDILSGWYQNSTNEVFRGIPIGPGDTVVDVGFGGGGSSLFCARRGALVTAIDHDPQVVEVMASKLAELPPHTHRALVADAHQLPLEDNFATCVICTEVLEHVDDPKRVMQELVRVGSPGARYLLSVPGSRMEGLQQQIAPPIHFQKPNHIRIFTQEQFVELVTASGLVVEAQTQYGFYHSIWQALFWACEVDITCPDHPALLHWSESWRAILDDTRSGPSLKKKLDAFLPSSQVIVASKP